jgi:hypothetical protein
VDAVLAAFEPAWVVALGENHGHLEFHELVIRLLEDPRASEVIDDIAVEWGNALYQDVVDRYVGGGEVPWDSVTMAWRNTVVSPNTVWDAPVYERFFREVRRINESLAPDLRFRVLLSDSPVEWSRVDSLPDLQPFFDRARSMADVVRRESVSRGRRALFIAGGLHVSRKVRVRSNETGVPVGEITPIAWLELYHPGSTYVIQSMGSAERLGLDDLVGDGPPSVIRLSPAVGPGAIRANRTTTLRNRDGSTPDVYGAAVLGDLVDAVIVWDIDQLTFPDPSPATYAIDWYWEALNRRSLLLRGQPMDPSRRP